MLLRGRKVELITLGIGAAHLWLLFMLRTLGFVAIAPLFSARAAPPPFRIVLVFFLTTLAFVAWAPRIATPVDAAGAQFIPAAISELVLGMMLGFIVGMVFVTFQFAGQFIGYQMGFAIVNVLDPHTQSQVSLIGEFLFTVALLAFLNLNLHHDILGLWHASYELAPPGAFTLSNLDVSHLVAICNNLVLLALKIAVPLLAFLMLTDLSLGIIARVMPQMNVFIIGIPLKIAMGMFLLSIVTLQFDPLIREVTYSYINNAGQLLSDLGA